LNELPQLWPEGVLPKSPAGFPVKNFKSLRFPLWTQNKARLIQAYLQLFEYITHHGTYIDGFAAPQEDEHPEMWAAKLVLEMRPKWFRDFWLCDLDPAGVEALKSLQSEHASARRRVNVLEGDFNEKVYDILNSGQITERKATFALLDQRTFECEWRTVEAGSLIPATTVRAIAGAAGGVCAAAATVRPATPKRAVAMAKRMARALSSLRFGYQERLHPRQRFSGFRNVNPSSISRYGCLT